MKQWMADDLYSIVNTLLEKANATKVLDTANSFTLQFNADDDEIETASQRVFEKLQTRSLSYPCF